jgi:hypothetical protein
MRGDLRADGLGPDGAGQIPGTEHIAGESPSAYEFAGAFHLVRLDHFITVTRLRHGWFGYRNGKLKHNNTYSFQNLESGKNCGAGL